jgi:hypothetical protein
MEPITQNKQAPKQARQLAMLKIVSRLLSHELHAQATSKSITLSRDEVLELQTCIDLFIEESARRGTGPGTLGVPEPPLVGARNN